ncbi:MAG: ATP-binding cassette domain-containing protein, partial [Pseudonocardiaceae bacterium]
DRVRRVIGCVGQRSGVDREATGRENLTLQGRIYGLRGRELHQRVHDLLERFELENVAGRLARTYSGGMQRKLDVAMGLVPRPRVLFLDEPTTGLDPESRATLWREITQLSEVEGVTILLTTHYLEEADRLASQLAIVDRGRVVAEGTPDQLKAELRGDAIHVELGNPQVNGRAQHALRGVVDVHDVAIDGATLRARVSQGSRALPEVLAVLESQGISVQSVTVSRPSLDDVYLQRAGRSFRMAEGES